MGAGAPLPVEQVDCTYAARGGHLEVLKWVREHGSPWDKLTCIYAAVSAPLEVLQWAMEHGAPVSPSHAQWYEHLLRRASCHGLPEEVQVVMFHQC